MLVLLALSILLSGAAVWLFARRDVGGTVALPGFLRLPERAMRPERALPVNAWSLRSVYTRSLGMIAVPTCWWTLVIAGFAAWMVVIVKQIETQLANLYASSPLLKDVITKVGGGDVATNATILSFLFVFLPLLLMAFAVTQANRWSADEEDGRLELVLATPQPRLQVLLGRFAALTTATVIIGVLTLAATAVASASHGLAARRGQSGRGHALDDSTGAAGGCYRLSTLRLATHGGGHRPLELFAGDLVLHQLYWPRFELVGCNVAAVRLLLLWHAVAAWSAAHEYAGRPGCRLW